LGPPVRAPPAAARPAGARQPMARVAEHLSCVAGARGRRRARLRGVDPALLGGRARARASPPGRRGPDGPRGRTRGLQAGPRHRVHAGLRPRPAGDGLRRPRAWGNAGRARREAHRARQRLARRPVDDERPRRLHLRGHAAGPVVDRLGDRRGPLCGARARVWSTVGAIGRLADKATSPARVAAVVSSGVMARAGAMTMVAPRPRTETVCPLVIATESFGSIGLDTITGVLTWTAVTSV